MKQINFPSENEGERKMCCEIAIISFNVQKMSLCEMYTLFSILVPRYLCLSTITFDRHIESCSHTYAHAHTYDTEA